MAVGGGPLQPLDGLGIIPVRVPAGCQQGAKLMLGIHIAPLGADANGGQAIGGALAGLIQIGQNFKIDLGLGRGAKAEPKNQYCAGKNAASGAGY